MRAVAEAGRREEAAALLRALVEIPSVNPRGRAPSRDAGEGEAAVAGFVRDWLEERGVAATVAEVLPGRPNVLAVLPGRDRRAVLLESHLDTVEAADGGTGPRAGQVRDGRLYGRGACDAKGALAAFMLATARLAARAPACTLASTVILAAVCDEEHGYRGVTRLLRDLGELGQHEVLGAVVGEPTDLLPVVAHKGVVRYTVRALGRAAHSSRPADGTNAISLLAPVLAHLAATPPGVPPHPLLGPATRCATRVRGGTAPNAVPARAEVDVDRRTLPGEDPVAVWRRERDEFIGLARVPGSLEVDEPFTVDYALDTPTTSSIVGALGRALRDHGRPADAIGLPFGTDASKLARAGIPSVVFGPGSVADAHSADESVAIADVGLAADVITALVSGLAPADGATPREAPWLEAPWLEAPCG
jgi:acetylornithine deacetylase/succinyl-diaminopimelate desuccinylase-like protein